MNLFKSCCFFTLCYLASSSLSYAQENVYSPSLQEIERLKKAMHQAESKGKQFLLVATDSKYVPKTGMDMEHDYLESDAVVHAVDPRHLCQMFSLSPSRKSSDRVVVVCIRFPTREECCTGFHTFRLTFVSEEALRSLMRIEGALARCLRVFANIRE